MDPLTQDERDSFRAYALDSRTEPDGSECQWASYTLRLLDENAALRQRVEELERERNAEAQVANAMLRRAEAAEKRVEELEQENAQLAAILSEADTRYGVLKLENARLCDKLAQAQQDAHDATMDEVKFRQKWADAVTRAEELDDLRAKLARVIEILESARASADGWNRTGGAALSAAKGE